MDTNQHLLSGVLWWYIFDDWLVDCAFVGRGERKIPLKIKIHVDISFFLTMKGVRFLNDILGGTRQRMNGIRTFFFFNPIFH